MARLPPLNALHTFVCAGEHGSFKKAAKELSVTPGAVSRQIQQLEDFFGVPLFTREHKSVQLSAKGILYFNQVKDFFSQLQQASNNLQAIKHRPPVIIDCGPSFATHWLLRKLPSFQTRHPNIAITVKNIGGPVQGDFDFAIRIHRDNFVGYPYTTLFTEVCAPVCSPNLAGIKKLQTPQDLQYFKTIHIGKRKELWPIWAQHAGIDISILKDQMAVDLAFLAIQATKNNSGIAVVPLVYVQPELKSGQLILPFKLKAPQSATYHLVRSNYKKGRDAQIFYDWLLEVATQYTYDDYGVEL